MPRRTFVIVFVLLFAALACSLPGSTSPPAQTPISSPSLPAALEDTVSPEETVTDSSAQVSTASPSETPDVEDPATPPPPSGLLEVLELNVASGKWTPEEGLLAGLQGLVGEGSLSESFGEMISGEGTGIILEAQQYLSEGTDEAAKTEMNRLLSLLRVSPEILEGYSEPEPIQSASGRPPGLASASADTSEDCAALWKAGFPENTELLCFLYKEQNLGGYPVRIYYPAWWTSGAVEFEYAQAAHEAIADAFAVYEAYGPIHAINLVFTILPNIEKATTLAMVPFSTTSVESCQILVYPLAITADQVYKSSTPHGVFKQTIAHEVFHCFQSINFTDKFIKSTWSVQDWWGEGSAEYFSNIVYPNVNFEWRWTDSFDSMALSNSLFDLSYENFEFFQHLANRIGNQGVLELIAGLPAGNSYEAHISTLAGYPDIENIFHEFGQSYVDHLISDTSGASIPGTISSNFLLLEVGSKPQSPETLITGPFTLGVAKIIFDEKQIYANVILSETTDGERSARPAEVQTGWLDDLPGEVIAGCFKVAFQVLFTSTNGSGASFETKMEINVVEEIGCDQCVVGTWELNKDSFEEHIVSLVNNPDFIFNFIAGGWEYKFGPNGEFESTFDQFVYNFIVLAYDTFENPIFTKVELTINGERDGLYYVDGSGNLVTRSSGTDTLEILEKVWINDELIEDQDLNEGGGLYDPASLGLSQYTCQGDILTIRIEPFELPENTPVAYDRK